MGLKQFDKLKTHSRDPRRLRRGLSAVMTLQVPLLFPRGFIQIKLLPNPKSDEDGEERVVAALSSVAHNAEGSDPRATPLVP